MKLFFTQVICACSLLLFAVSTSYGKDQLISNNKLHTGKEYSHAFSYLSDDPELPNVLLIGDSISIGYTVDVRKLLKGKADVFRIETNGKNTLFGLKNLDKWLGKRKWDIIHFNWGLWDICYRNLKSTTQGRCDKINGTLIATPIQYRMNIEKIVHKLKRTNSKLIWCTTTPVPKFDIGRNEGDELTYNLIAEKIMRKNGIAINDLHSHALLKLPGIKKMKGDVHFTTQGYIYLAEKVANEILLQLAN